MLLHFQRTYRVLTKNTRKAGLLGLTLVAASVLAVLPTASAHAGSVLPRGLRPVPSSNFTPNFLGADQAQQVLAIASATTPADPSQEHILYGGNFTTVAPPGVHSARAGNCSHFADHNLKTRSLSCWARFNGVVNTITTVGISYAYVGGEFTSVTAGGRTVARHGLVKLNLANRTIDTSFNASLSGGGNRVEVNDLRIHRGYLVVAGRFTSVRGVSRQALATVTGTGALSNYFNLNISGALSSGTIPHVYRIAIQPQGQRAVIIGNFQKVGGQSRPRVAMLKLGTTSSTVSTWYAPAFSMACAARMPAYVRAVDFSPNGAEFVIGTTGARPDGFGLTVFPRLCDATSIWPTNDLNGARPRIVSYTPADTIHSVLHTGSIIYIGGHHKAENSELYVNGRRVATPVVKVSGIGTINAVTGRAYAWGAGRDRGIGLTEMTQVPATRYHYAGVFMGSDTEYWYCPNWRTPASCPGGNIRQYHNQRAAFLPL